MDVVFERPAAQPGVFRRHLELRVRTAEGETAPPS